ncbi:MAG: nucleoside triphosphate pyrophosphohydrolase [Pseudomonadota bacterium]
MSEIDKLLEIMAALRNPKSGCPWDLQQDFSSIAPYTIEEAYEVADAIARDDMPELESELGDLLLQVVFHAQMAKEAGHFDFDDVTRSITEKMRRRHPHVFGGAEANTAAKVEGSWERIKAEERKDKNDASALAGVALALPALKRAEKLGKRAARVGFDWPDPLGPAEKVREELEEIAEADAARDCEAVAEEIGDALFAIANLARHHKVDPEAALSAANGKFERRFRAVESALAARGQRLEDLPLEALEEAWQGVKEDEAG